MPRPATLVSFRLPPDLYKIAAERAAAHGQTIEEYAAERFTASLRAYQQRSDLPAPTARPPLRREVEPRWKDKHKTTKPS